jgi:ureidoglycolate lyase
VITLIPRALTQAEFAPFGDVIEMKASPDKIINQGMCGRHHDLATLDFADGRAGISLFDAEARHLPCDVALVERHPLGSQAFIPISGTPFLVIVAEDDHGTPVNIQAFITRPRQSVNLHRGVWHGVLCPLGDRGLYAVVDRIGPGDNLEEYWFDDPPTVGPMI